jgi:hypothetical protein
VTEVQTLVTMIQNERFFIIINFLIVLLQFILQFLPLYRPKGG